MSARHPRAGVIDRGSTGKPAAAWKAAVRWIAVPLVLLVVASNFSPLFAADRAFTLSGVNLTLEDVSSEVEVRYRSMRLNRALNVWNVEVTLTNKGSRTFRGPFVVLIDSFAGTTGPQQTEGVDDSTPAKPIYDLSNWVPGETFVPGTNSLPRTLSLGFANGTPSLTTRVYAKAASGYALGLTRSLNDMGQPLPGVQVEETGSQTIATNQTDGAFGLVTLGQTNGQHVWKFSAPDHLPVWRAAALGGTDVTVLPNPRLTRRSSQSGVVTTVQGGQVATADGSVQITFPPGIMAQNATAVLTPLTAQTLPALLPLGWSPLQAFWLELTQEPASPVSASLRPWGPLNAGDTVVLARWDTGTLQWIAAQMLAGSGANAVATSIPGDGAYCLVVADSGATAPPAPQAGQPLSPSTVALPQPGSLSAAGSVNPASSPASRVAELVTASAQVTFTNQSGPLPSGVILRCEVMENYRLRDGSRRLLPQYENFIIGYQRPGDNDLRTLQANFPLRPLLLLGSDELEAATVSVDVLSPAPFEGGILDATGGQVILEGIRLLAGTGNLAGGQAVQIRQQNPTNFSDLVFGGATIVQVFELGVAGVAPDRRLTAQISGLPANSLFVLARVVSHNGLYGLEPRERLATDSNGNLTTREPASGERLPGINSAGQYVLLRISAPQGLVTGVARNSTGQPAPDLPVRIVGQPWLTFSGTGGAFRLIAPVGSVDVTVTDLTTGDTGQTAVVVADPQVTVNAAPSTAAVGPSVVSVNPTNAATLVPRVTPIVIQFSEPINPGSLGVSGIQLLGTNGQPVEASLTLNLRNTIATLLPTTQLAASTLHTVRLSTNIADFTGLKLDGANSFVFTTESDALDRIQTAQVVSYEPTNGFAVMTGSPGIAEPESPVILVNETTGRSATILSKPDGSFTNSIEAGVDDFLSAVIVNKNGTRNTMPVTRQIFRDGRVGLFNGGGVLDAQSENGLVQVLIEPGSVPNKTVFKLESLSFSNVLAAVSNTPPEGGRLLGGFNFSVKGDRLKQSADVVFPVNIADLDIPAGGKPEDATFALAFPRQVDGVTTYEVIDRMVYQDGKLTTHSPPFAGLGTDIAGLFLPGFDDALFALLLTPIQLYVGSSAVVSGKVLSAFVNTNGATPPWIEGTERFLPGARVTVSPLGEAARPGRLRPGTVVATSGADGSFVMMLPAGAEVALRATHPRYPGLAAYKQSTLPGYELNFVLALLGRVLSAYDLVFLFENPASGPDTNTPPELFYSHFPLFPAPGTNAIIRLLATDNASAPTITATVDSVQSSATNVNLTPADVVFQLTSEESVGAFGKR
ncbi:MAG TPA: Ig-like domain-containing protein, partial [Verrucomicrobiae bacterium]|nr:Ig-like domain-containing protein [Verrucomicrobiae bacterium]